MYAQGISPWILALAGAVVGASCQGHTTAQCCSQLVKKFPDQVIGSSSASYDSWNERWADTAELSPSCIFRPKSAKDVGAAMKIIAPKGKNPCKFSIKSGGHTPWPGLNNVDNGVAIELSQLNQVKISKDKSYVSLGSGGRWHDAYEATNGTGLVFPGGRCPGTGVGGLTTGGGYSWFTGEVGFVSDSVKNFEVVLASGEVVNANAGENEDLYRALKGGNNNFGIVTRFDIRTIKHSQQVWGGLVILEESEKLSMETVLPALQKFTDDSTGVHKTSGLTIEYFLDPVNGEQILLWLIDTDQKGSHEALKPFSEIEPKLLNQVYESSIVDYPSNIPEVSRVLMADATFVNDLNALKEVYKVSMKIKDELAPLGVTFDLQFEPFSRHIFEASKKNGGNMMGLENVKEDLLLAFIMPLWTDEAHDEAVYAAARKWYHEVKKVTKALNKDASLEFPNYAAGFQDVMASYGPKSLNYMKEVAKKYDPLEVFQKAVGGYKLTGNIQ